MFTEVAASLENRAARVGLSAQKAKEQARVERRANNAKTRFIAVMSHEIRNPLQVILLQLEMLEVTKLQPNQRDYVLGIGRASQALLQIVNDILEVTKIESGVVALEAQPMSLRLLVELVVHEHTPAAAAKGVELVAHVPPELNTSVIGDAARVRQVLHNLLSNATKFTESGEIEVTLDRADEDEAGDATGKTGPKWLLSVRDTGIGIDEAGQEKLFQEFSQVDETSTRMYGGTGLGLFICKELSELMGGTVSVESERGVGSTFTASFVAPPAGTIDSAPVHIVSSSVEWVVMIHAVNATLRATLRSYAAYFLSGSPRVVMEESDQVRGTDARVSAVLKECGLRRRLLLIASYADCSSPLLELLASRRGDDRCVSVLLVEPRARDTDEVRAERGRNLVDKPIALCTFCTSLERAMYNLSTSSSSTDCSSSVTVSSPLDDSTRQMSDGTMTYGTRLLPTADALSPNGSSTILIVDDFDLIRVLVQQLVATLGYSTLLASNGREAVDLVRDHYDRISLVLMDCEMPVLDGYAATEEIRAMEAARGIPSTQQLYICAMTANAMQEDARKCMARQMSGVLAKPVKIVDLQRKLVECARTPDERGIEVTQRETGGTTSRSRTPRQRRRKKK